MFGRRRPDSRLTLRPVTPASYIAGRAALGVMGDDDEVDVAALPDAALVAFVDAVVAPVTSTPTYANRDTLVAVAGRVYAAWAEAVAGHDRTARERAEVACERLNWWPGKASDSHVPLPEELPAIYGERWPDFRSLPLWEVTLAGLVRSAHDARDKVMKALHNTN